MVTTAERLARAVLQNAPFVRCFRCLSAQAGIIEKEAREAAQLLLVREEFSLAKRVCQICGHTDETLVRDKAP
jgi:hypothetical protein